jgi:hypothetical protein
MLLSSIEIPLQTHFAISDNKFKENRYKKANGQLLYNGAINRFTRNIFMKNMHKYIYDFIDELVIETFPIVTEFIFYLPKSYQNIKRLRGELRFPPNLDVEPTFDVDNISSIWKKAIHDALQHMKCIPGDDTRFIRRNEEEIVFIDNYEEMKIILNIKTYDK